MTPTLYNGEILLLKKYDKKLERFDIVVLNYEDDKLIKRIIGLPGEHVYYKDSNLYINDEKLEEEFLPDNLKFDDFDNVLIGKSIIPDNSYLVLGDNRNNSTDSRIIGFIDKEDILGTTSFRLFPLKKIGQFS